MMTAKPRSPTASSSPTRHRVRTSAPAPPNFFGTPSVRMPCLSASRIQSHGMRSAAVGSRSRRITSGLMTCPAKSRAIPRQRCCSSVKVKSTPIPRYGHALKPHHKGHEGHEVKLYHEGHKGKLFEKLRCEHPTINHCIQAWKRELTVRKVTFVSFVVKLLPSFVSFVVKLFNGL